MSSRFLANLMLVGSLAVAACQREDRHDWSRPQDGAAANTSPDTIFPGGSAVPPVEAGLGAMEGNAHAIANGQSLYNAMNCGGCHSHGGGGMGPALMDDQWRYGGRIDQIAASIRQGRAQGMPAWGAKLTDQQIGQIAAYVRSMSGQVRKDAVPARADEVSNTPPNTQTSPEPIRSAEVADQ